MPPANGRSVSDQPPILILGVPRSGTSWLHRILSGGEGIRPVLEPDNESERPWALIAKHRLGRFPALKRGDVSGRYEALWAEAFSGGPEPFRVELARKLQYHLLSFDTIAAAASPSGHLPLAAQLIGALGRPTQVRRPRLRPLVKSVHAVLCADWLVERFGPAVVAVRRDPVELVASWQAVAAMRERGGGALEYGGQPAGLFAQPALNMLRGRYGDPPADRRRALAWIAGALISELEAFVSRFPATLIVDFDAACLEPERALRPLVERLGLGWSESIAAKIRELDRPGTGWEVARETGRVPGAWRRRLSTRELAEIEAGLEPFR